MTTSTEQARFRASLFDNPEFAGALLTRAAALVLTLGLAAIVLVAGWAALGTAEQPSLSGANQALAMALADAAKAENSLASRGAGAVLRGADLPGGAGQISGAAHAFMHDVREAYSAYHATLSGMNYYQLLVPMRVDSDRAFVRANRTLERMRDAVETRERRIDAAVAAFRAQISSAQIDANAKRMALVRLDRVISANSYTRKRETALEENLIDEQKDMLADLSATKDNWDAAGPTVLVFRDEGAMRTYHAHVASLIRISSALNAVIARSQRA